jgi:hypothetical protein
MIAFTSAKLGCPFARQWHSADRPRAIRRVIA